MAIPGGIARTPGIDGSRRRAGSPRTDRPVTLASRRRVIQSPAMFCPNCGKANDDNAKFCQVCGVSLQSNAAAAAPGGTATIPVMAGTGTYAGFFTRLLAFIIDCIILALATGMVTVGTHGIGVVLSFFAPWLYEAFM